jgi:hypothetical protein
MRQGINAQVHHAGFTSTCPATVPAVPGTYILVLRCSAAHAISIGRLGRLLAWGT